MPFFPYMFASDNPYYQHLLRYQVAAVAAQGRSNMGKYNYRLTKLLLLSFLLYSLHARSSVVEVLDSR